jgi:hypothetical protein
MITMMIMLTLKLQLYDVPIETHNVLLMNINCYKVYRDVDFRIRIDKELRGDQGPYHTMVLMGIFQYLVVL